MAFSGVRCPECNSKDKVFRKRRTGIRYAQVFDDYGIAIGENRYYHLHCLRCEALFFIQDQCHFDTPEKASEKIVVPEDAFYKASLFRPGMMRIGNTASQYSVCIAAGADTTYALKRVKYKR